MIFPLLLSSKINLNKKTKDVFNYKIKTGIFGNSIKVKSGNVQMKKLNEKKLLSINIFSGIVSYNFYKPNDSIYIEKTSFPKEEYIYKKQEDSWKLIKYEATKEREYKKNLERKFKTKSLPLVEISKKYLDSKIGDTTKFFLLGEEYYFFKKSENKNQKTAKFCIGGIKKRDDDETLFSNQLFLEYKNIKEYPNIFKTSFEVKKSNLFKGKYSIIGEKKE